MLLYDWSNRVIGYQDDEYAASDSFDPKKGTEMAKRALKIRAGIKADESGRLPDPRSREGLADMYAYTSDLANYRLSNPGEDIVSTLLNADDDQGPITVEEFETMFFLFAVAGNETLRNGIPGGLLALLTHPEQLTQLVNDPSLLDGAIEEMLRYAPPVVHFRRTATCDLELGGRSVEAGEKIVVYHAAANRDPKVFENPDRFDILRSPNDHLTFGAGPHFCLGSRLARVQMRALFQEIITKLPNLEMAGEPEHLVSNFQNGLKHLPIRWST
jgi:cytochrome P450